MNKTHNKKADRLLEVYEVDEAIKMCDECIKMHSDRIKEWLRIKKSIEKLKQTA
jgi:hypothetical protein